MTRQSRHRRFQLEPVEILARWTIEGKSYRTLLRHTPVHEALALIVEHYYVGAVREERDSEEVK